ncbi:hypothetical protein [Alicyclobacillus sp. ALC3]|uniref:hypothetical protein n=1 Tax=Alicyclobacillus sp. ALC3 TaxID=2796143 RepID=UPI002378A458|nr:hypothetical protein [Alicyclobacillus sp. ALC3]WDL95749.1 hypothetical protein JC200_15440 [Alicyclobacillus sp. ALC3]
MEDGLENSTYQVLREIFYWADALTTFKMGTAIVSLVFTTLIALFVAYASISRCDAKTESVLR